MKQAKQILQGLLHTLYSENVRNDNIVNKLCGTLSVIKWINTLFNHARHLPVDSINYQLNVDSINYQLNDYQLNVWWEDVLPQINKINNTFILQIIKFFCYEGKDNHFPNENKSGKYWRAQNYPIKVSLSENTCYFWLTSTD